ncbi:MAG: hypothetical protein ACOYN5_03955 [Bacteroidales bacterium]
MNNTNNNNKYLLILSSSIQFTLAVLIIRFVINLYTSILMYLFSISYVYRPFGNTYTSVATGNWTDARVFFVFGLGVFLLCVIGILLVRKLNSTKTLEWSSRLMLTWLAFIMVNMLPFSMAAAVLFYDDFGFSYTNLFEVLIVRALLALLAIIIAIYFRTTWLWLFLRSSYSIDLIDNVTKRKQFIGRVFKIPWFLGTLLLSMFTFLPYRYWSWFLIIVLMGMVVLPAFNFSFPERKPRLNKSDKSVLESRSRFLIYLLILIALFAFSYFRISV